VLTPKIGIVTYCAFVSFSVALLKSGLALLRQAGYEICAWVPPSLFFKRCD
jgi:hypothetical protein